MFEFMMKELWNELKPALIIYSVAIGGWWVLATILKQG